jgi:hypothetical protein
LNIQTDKNEIKHALQNKTANAPFSIFWLHVPEVLHIKHNKTSFTRHQHNNNEPQQRAQQGA